MVTNKLRDALEDLPDLIREDDRMVLEDINESLMLNLHSAQFAATDHLPWAQMAHARI